jgi:Xaa-Pro dipeptidase
MTNQIQQLYPGHFDIQQARLEQVLEGSGFDTLMIYSGHPATAFLDDYQYHFKANPHFLAWLPLPQSPSSMLLLRPAQKPVLHYYQPDDYWHDVPPDPEAWWADLIEINIHGEPVTPMSVRESGSVALIAELDESDLPGGMALNPRELVNRLHINRTVKTDYEIACMAAASQTGAFAHTVAEQVFRGGGSEMEIHLAFLQAAGLTDFQSPYQNIVALNEHGSTLHYTAKQLQSPAESLSFLIDAGTVWNGYASDITRTYSAEADEFADMIAAMDVLQQQFCSRVVAGADYCQLHLDAHLGIAAMLNEFGLITMTPEAALETGVSFAFYPHGLGHFLGLQVHDVAGLIADASGTPIPTPEGHPTLRLTRVLEAGNVLTIEPGVYFIESLLQKLQAGEHAAVVNWQKIEKFKPYGGIRIEDNVVVGTGSNRNLTREAFAALAN